MTEPLTVQMFDDAQPLGEIDKKFIRYKLQVVDNFSLHH